MDERELIQRYLQQQQPPILDDIMPDDSKAVQSNSEFSSAWQDNVEFERAAAVHSGKLIYVQGGRFSIGQSK